MAHLASRPEFSSTIPEMSEATQVPAPYLRKVLNRLRDAGIVATQRGAGGGIILKADPDDLTILRVLNAVDPIKRVERCPLGLPEHFKLCPLHAIAQDFRTAAGQFFYAANAGAFSASNCSGVL